ncbi:MAG: hypothetical protein J7K32_03960 [Deltaproteobacteria bacterium]|nr:hypothetical protein [Deltaproteobacteria bacterium]
MRKRQYKKIVHEGQYVAEVEIELIDADEGCSPCLSLDDALKLDDVRDAFRRGDLRKADRLARVFTLPSLALNTAGEQGAAPDRQQQPGGF